MLLDDAIVYCAHMDLLSQMNAYLNISLNLFDDNFTDTELISLFNQSSQVYNYQLEYEDGERNLDLTILNDGLLMHHVIFIF